MKKMGVILFHAMLFLVNPVYPQERGVPWDGDEFTYVRKFEREDGLPGTRVQVRWSLQRSSQSCGLFELGVTLAPEDALWGPVYRLQGGESDPQAATMSSSWRSANVTKFANEPTADEKYGSCLWEFYNLEKWGHPNQVSIWELEPWPGYQYVILNVPEEAIPLSAMEGALHKAAVDDLEVGLLSQQVSDRCNHDTDPCVSGFQDPFSYSGQCHEEDWAYYTLDARSQGVPAVTIHNGSGEPRDLVQVCGHDGVADEDDLYCGEDQNAEWVAVPVNP